MFITVLLFFLILILTHFNLIQNIDSVPYELLPQYIKKSGTKSKW